MVGSIDDSIGTALYFGMHKYYMYMTCMYFLIPLALFLNLSNPLLPLPLLFLCTRFEEQHHQLSTCSMVPNPPQFPPPPLLIEICSLVSGATSKILSEEVHVFNP